MSGSFNLGGGLKAQDIKVTGALTGAAVKAGQLLTHLDSLLQPMPVMPQRLGNSEHVSVRALMPYTRHPVVALGENLFVHVYVNMSDSTLWCSVVEIDQSGNSTQTYEYQIENVPCAYPEAEKTSPDRIFLTYSKLVSGYYQATAIVLVFNSTNGTISKGTPLRLDDGSSPSGVTTKPIVLTHERVLVLYVNNQPTNSKRYCIVFIDKPTNTLSTGPKYNLPADLNQSGLHFWGGIRIDSSTAYVFSNSLYVVYSLLSTPTFVKITDLFNMYNVYKIFPLSAGNVANGNTQYNHHLIFGLANSGTQLRAVIFSATLAGAVTHYEDCGPVTDAIASDVVDVVRLSASAFLVAYRPSGQTYLSYVLLRVVGGKLVILGSDRLYQSGTTNFVSPIAVSLAKINYDDYQGRIGNMIAFYGQSGATNIRHARYNVPVDIAGLCVRTASSSNTDVTTK